MVTIRVQGFGDRGLNERSNGLNDWSRDWLTGLYTDAISVP